MDEIKEEAQADEAPKKKVRKPMSAEVRAKLSKALKKYYSKPENRTKIAAGITPAMRQEMRKRAKEYWTPERKNEASQRAKQMWDEFRQFQAQKKRADLMEVKSA